MSSSSGVLVDECLPPRLAQWLTENGCQDATSVRDLSMLGADDMQLLKIARQNNQVLLTLDWKRAKSIKPSDSPGVVCLRIRERTRQHIEAVLSVFMASEHLEKCKHNVLRVSEERLVVIDCSGKSSEFSF